jgi:uncharacterized protein (DUF2236 family)
MRLPSLPPLPVTPPHQHLASLLARLFPATAGRGLPLRDREPDPGLFGPDSVTWRVMREPALVLGAGRALLLQVAHPLVAQGALDHSAYATDPFGRLERTMLWVTFVSYGTAREARAATRPVNRLHRGIAGTLPAGAGTPRVRPGTAYAATDPRLLLWVHATFVDTMLATHDALVGGLDAADRDRFVREWHAVARLMGVPARLLWPDHAAMIADIESEIASGSVLPGAGSRRVARTILRPPLPSPALRPLWDTLILVMAGLLPPAVRRGYGIAWTPAHAAAHLALRTTLRTGGVALPRRFRVSPVHDWAQARVRGELVPSAA